MTPRPDKDFKIPPCDEAREEEDDRPLLPVGYAITVEHLLSLGTYQYIWQIPKHQRAYTWEVDKDDANHVEEFFSDIQQAIDGPYVHSFGTIDATQGDSISLRVKPRGPEPDEDYQKILVNDGQQRLTTMFLAYAAICQIKLLRNDREYRRDLTADPTREDARKSFRLYKSRDLNSPVYRLHLQIPGLRETLWQIIEQGDGFAFEGDPPGIQVTRAELERKVKKDSKPENRLISAYVHLRKKLGELDVDGFNDWEAGFYCSEISYIVSQTPPHLMFETRNDRGLKVSGLDIVKNWMLYAEEFWDKEDSPIGCQPDIKWWNALSRMEEGNVYNEKALLGHIRTIIHGTSLGSNEKDASGFKKRYPISTLSPDRDSKREEFVEFVEAMEWVAEAMKEVYSPTNGIPNGSFATQKGRGMNGQQEAEALVNLINISCRMERENKASTIILLTYHFLRPADWVKVLRFLEKMIFRVHLVGKVDLGNLSTGDGELGKYCKDFYVSVKGKDVDDDNDYGEISDALDELLDELCKFTISKQDLTELYTKIVQQSNRYDGSTWTRYLLFHWEMAGPQFTNKEIAKLRLFSGALDWGDLSKTHDLFQIEHIAAKAGWEKEVPENPLNPIFADQAGQPYWEDAFDNTDTYDKWKNYLGNLILSRAQPNRIYSNLPYIAALGDGETQKTHEKRWKYINYPGSIDWYQVRALGNTYKIWNQKTIEDRQERIARWAVRHWKLPCERDTLPNLTDRKLKYLEEHTEQFKRQDQKLGDIDDDHPPEGPEQDEDRIHTPDIPVIEREGIDAEYNKEHVDYNEHDEYDVQGEG